ncbi:MAG TPA: carbon-nitrogen hydrolase family protein [Longimicrobiales bacterium]|nr:carbon-nitrogen hydrolase family protein [Longimicrobiales bacterium]
MPIVKAAVLQAETCADLESGLARTAGLIEEAASHGAKLVAFPETWIPGYPAWLDVCRSAGLWDNPAAKRAYRVMAENAVSVPGAAAGRLGELASANGVTLVLGVIERVESGPGRGTLYNALLTFGPDGRLLNHHRKLVPTYTERLVWGPGDAAGVRAVSTPAGRVGGLVCWEHWMPLARQALHESGEDIHVAVWPTVKEMNLVACRQYAFEGRCWVLAVGSLQRASSLPDGLDPDPSLVAGPDAWVVRGGSAIIGPDGAVVAGPVYDEPTLLLVDLDLDRVREESMALDVAGHYDRPDCFRLERVPDGTRRGAILPP